MVYEIVLKRIDNKDKKRLLALKQKRDETMKTRQKKIDEDKEKKKASNAHSS